MIGVFIQGKGCLSASLRYSKGTFFNRWISILISPWFPPFSLSYEILHKLEGKYLEKREIHVEILQVYNLVHEKRTALWNQNGME